MQTAPAPVIAGGRGYTTTGSVAAQPVEETVYVTNEVPAETPPTTPDPSPTVAMEASPLVQVPPLVASLKVATDPAHTAGMPVIANGAA
jgi:hypothetical protein